MRRNIRDALPSVVVHAQSSLNVLLLKLDVSHLEHATGQRCSRGVAKHSDHATVAGKVFGAKAYGKPFSLYENAKNNLAVGAYPECFALPLPWMLVPDNSHCSMIIEVQRGEFAAKKLFAKIFCSICSPSAAALSNNILCVNH